jgi:hypothetical protein
MFSKQRELNAHIGRVQEIKINERKLPLSSSARARYLSSFVSFRNFLASLVKRMAERVSFMTAIVKSKTAPVNLERNGCSKLGVATETVGTD